MYAKVKRSLPEMYALTVCMWLKSNASPGVGTPFSYAVPGQANELVLIEWGNNPMEILINDKVGLGKKDTPSCRPLLAIVVYCSTCPSRLQSCLSSSMTESGIISA